MPWRSHKTGSHYRVHRRTLYGPATTQKYSDIMSEIHTKQDAEEASHAMLQEFNSATQRDKKRRVKQALVQAANRAGVASRNKNFSPEERSKWADIERIYRRDIDKMKLPEESPN